MQLVKHSATTEVAPKGGILEVASLDDACLEDASLEDAFARRCLHWMVF